MPSGIAPVSLPWSLQVQSPFRSSSESTGANKLSLKSRDSALNTRCVKYLSLVSLMLSTREPFGKCQEAPADMQRRASSLARDVGISSSYSSVRSVIGTVAKTTETSMTKSL